MCFEHVQIIHYSTNFWELTSPEMLHNCLLCLLKSPWISLFLLFFSVFEFLYTFFSSNLTFLLKIYNPAIFCRNKFALQLQLSICKTYLVAKYWLILYCQSLWLTFVLIELFYPCDNSFNNMTSWKKGFPVLHYDQYSTVRRKLTKTCLWDEWNKLDEY